MSIFKKLFGPKQLSPTDKILGAMQLFTDAAFLMVPPSDFDTDPIRSKRVFVFLFGAIDSLIQHHRITDDARIELLRAFLRRTFPTMTDAGIRSTYSFLCSASADPAWVPVMQRGGETMVAWSRGEAAAPSRLLQVVHYGIEGL